MRATDAVRLGITAFCGNAESDDDDIAEILVRAGVPRGVADEVVTFLPLAFGRQLLTGASFSDGYVRDDQQFPLMGEPIYAAAAREAQYAGRDEMNAIAMRSSEVNAVNSALHNGSKLEDLQLSPPYLGTPRATDAHLGMDPGHWVTQVLGQHNVRLGPGQTFTAHVFPNQVTAGEVRLQLDIRVESPVLGRRTIVESFAGWGATFDEAVTMAMDKFFRSSLHPLMASTVHESLGADQVRWLDLGRFRMCYGPWLAQGPDIGLHQFFDALMNLVTNSPLSPEAHWIRIFRMARGTQVFGTDALLDNESWPAAEKLLHEWRWHMVDELSSIRLFTVLLPK